MVAMPRACHRTGLLHVSWRRRLPTARPRVVGIVPGLQKVIGTVQPAVVPRLALLGGDVEIQRPDGLGGNEDGAPNRTRIIDVGGVLIADESFQCSECQ